VLGVISGSVIDILHVYNSVAVQKSIILQNTKIDTKRLTIHDTSPNVLQ
jgi:hypothetical protein